VPRGSPVRFSALPTADQFPACGFVYTFTAAGAGKQSETRRQMSAGPGKFRPRFNATGTLKFYRNAL
jgi:hypothetical protein